MIYLNSISEFNALCGLPHPEHPMFCVYRHSEEMTKNAHKDIDLEPVKINFYVITMKKLKRGSINYGRTKYDCDNGTLFFFAQGQETIMDDVEFEPGGFTILFDTDFFLGLPLAKEFIKYGFFDYSINETLHISPKEEKVLLNIYENIETEYFNNTDEFSRSIIVSHLETLLKYSDRYYKRQFINREQLNKSLNTKFQNLLKEYVSTTDLMESGVPSLDWLANELSVSKRYLSDSIKTETGKSAKDQINLFLIEEAKNLLLTPNMSISETAYKLGFEYPHYFSRLFKKKTGMSPKEYIKKHSLN
jgi:AraC-like DNA-binding protein